MIFQKPDGNSVAINSGTTRADGVGFITLPEACYTAEGNFTLSIRLTSDGATATIRMIDGTVVRTADGSFVNPGTIITDLNELRTLVEQAEAAATAINAIRIENETITGTRYRVKVTKTATT